MCGSSEADCDAVKAKVYEIQKIVMFHFRRNYAVKQVLKTVLYLAFLEECYCYPCTYRYMDSFSIGVLLAAQESCSSLALKVSNIVTFIHWFFMAVCNKVFQISWVHQARLLFFFLSIFFLSMIKCYRCHTLWGLWMYIDWAPC